MNKLLLPGALCLAFYPCIARAIDDASPLAEKAAWFQQDLLDKHWLDGLYVSIVPAAPTGTKLPHSVNEPGNVIHSGVWTGRYLGGVGYQYAVTRDPQVREHGGQILRALRILQEVTGKPGLLARGYVTGHGPVVDWEREGNDSKEWHQGTGSYADYRWYGDVSVDNFNAVLYGYAIYFDLAADDEQKKYIAHDVDRLMTHLLDNHCLIVDVDGEPTMWGQVGFDPDPERDAFYEAKYSRELRRYGAATTKEAPLRASLMLLPDLLIARHITGKERYQTLYNRVVERYKTNPEPEYLARPITQERMARLDHSSEGQSFEALYNLIRYERDPELLARYNEWLRILWQNNWSEGNSLFAYMTLALLPRYRDAAARQAPPTFADVPYAVEGLALARESLVQFPIDRVFRPVMNSIRPEIEINEFSRNGRRLQAARPLPMKERPLDNEYVWKSNPYQLDAWLKPTITSMQFSCDDPQVAWFSDSSGRAYRTLDRGKTWQNVSTGMMGASVKNLAVSDTRTFVLWASTDKGMLVSRDGGLSWRAAPDSDQPKFVESNPREWLKITGDRWLKINDAGELVSSRDEGKTTQAAMSGWRIPRATSLLATPWGIIAAGPGGAYGTTDGKAWQEISLWREQETGAADFLHAYWMGRFYGFLPND